MTEYRTTTNSEREALKALMPKRLGIILPDLLVVGGAVRDTIMGITPNDIDLTGPYTAHAVVTKLRDHNISAQQLNATYETVIISMYDEYHRHVAYEYTPFRTDLQGDGRNTTFASCNSIEEDLKRRDLTMNSLASDADGQLIDPNDGYADIKGKLLRAVGDPVLRIREDFSRGLRLPYFADKFPDFTIDKRTLIMIRNIRTQMAYVGIGEPDVLKAELVTKIFNKVFSLGKGHGGRFLSLLLEHGAFSISTINHKDSFWYDFETMSRLIHPPKWHTHDPAHHLFRVVNDVLTKKQAWAAMFHDIGKAHSWQASTEFPWNTFIDHEYHADKVKDYCERLRLDNVTTEGCILVHSHHMRVKHMEKKSKIRQLQLDVGPHLRVLEEVSRADAGPNKPFNAKPFESLEEEIKDILLGRHLLARGLEPGLELGNRLKYAKHHQIEYGITDLEELESIAFNVDSVLLGDFIRINERFKYEAKLLARKGK